jgi:phosphopantothenoylcysteine decarboxylase/phosphopantothenate--cysteine ligase
MARVLLGITGGIAAYKACELIRLFVKAGHRVQPLPTAGAERFVTRETFFALARRSAAADDGPYPHLQQADVLVVAPLTANTLAKLAHGLADNVLTEAALAHAGPVVVAPAMNVRMWHSAATQQNIATLRARGVEVLGPATGDLAEGETGEGRMVEPAEIFARVERILRGTPSALDGLHVLVSAGGTREPLDSVRYVGNRSSGRMGVALAEEARKRGASVTLLAANLAVSPPNGVEVIAASTAADMAREALARADADVIVMAAAVADYAPTALTGKRAKDRATWTVDLEPTLDIAHELGTRRRDGQILVTFGAESGADGLARKRRMLDDKNADLVVFNDVSVPGIAFDSDENEVVLVTRAGEQRVDRAPKSTIACAVLDAVEALLSGQGRA